MKVTGQVIKQKENFVFVRASRPEACEHCSNSGICNKKDVEICAYNDIGAEPGDWVTVETNEDKSALLIFCYLFLTPVAILFLSYYLYTLFPWLVLTAIPLVVIYYLILRKINKTHSVKARAIAPAMQPAECAEL